MDIDLEVAAKKKKNAALRTKTVKSQSIQAAIVARRSAGQSKSLIARELQIAPNTVSSIIALSSIDEMLEDGRLSVHKLIPKSVAVIDSRLDKCSETAAIEVLKGTGVLRSKADVQINVAAVTSNSWYQRRNAQADELEAITIRPLPPETT